MTSVEKLILIKSTVFSLMYAFVRYDKKIGKQALIMFDGLLKKPPCTIKDKNYACRKRNACVFQCWKTAKNAVILHACNLLYG